MVKVIRRVRFAPKHPSISSTLIQTPCSRNHSNLKKTKRLHGVQKQLYFFQKLFGILALHKKKDFEENSLMER